MMMTMVRYTGRISTVRSGEHYGFVGLSTIAASDGLADKPDTTFDIFVHDDDCDFTFAKDVNVSFEVASDTARGGDALRAFNVSEIRTGQLAVAGTNPVERTALTDPRSLYVPPTPAQQGGMKYVDPDTVNAVLANKPMARIPRDGRRSEDPKGSIRSLVARIFPRLATVNAEMGGDLADESFDDVINSVIEDHRSLGMKAQADEILGQVELYKSLRTVLKSGDELLTPESILPIEYLPDLFMAVPVWYYWTDEATTAIARELQKDSDPHVHPRVSFICDLVPNQRWTDTFLMFNRRMRTLPDYQGDIIPTRIIARMRKMAPLFDQLVIMTPYHDVAGKDWEDINWLRSIDPYVVGFLKGVPLMFVIGRFSDSGTFPAYSELLADTINFLRQNAHKLEGFNAVHNPYWYNPFTRHTATGPQRGTQLMQHTADLLAAFDKGLLFDWLRGEDVALMN
ncbi:hypothetical protein BH11PAT2_BH11PAT2_02520 [soil metagenome]